MVFAGNGIVAAVIVPRLPLFLLLFVLLLAACDTTPPRTTKPGGRTDPERVLVVINRRSAASEEVGRYYMERRGIPVTHVARVDVDPADEIGDLGFRTKLLDPVRAAIAALPVRIDFIVLTTGIPLRLDSKRGYSVDAHLAGMNLSIPPMVGFDSLWLKRYRNPYYGSREPFDSEKFGMYLVTRLDCAQVADCKALVDRSLAARATRGPFYFDATSFSTRGDGYATLNRALYTAAARLRFMGLEATMDTAGRFVALPQPVMGYVSWGSNDVNYDSVAYRAMRFLPGALAETFVSTSARTFGPVTEGQSRIVDLIAQGVTGVKGYVSEPYTLALANPDILFDRYVRGRNLAEAFYAASVMVLWKDVVVGDPLCAPYAGLPAALPGPRQLQ
ncbi:MAG: TIGR03790 family protein [Gemmatimonadota bacterium]